MPMGVASKVGVVRTERFFGGRSARTQMLMNPTWARERDLRKMAKLRDSMSLQGPKRSHMWRGRGGYRWR